MTYTLYYTHRAELEDYAKRFADFQASLTETNARFNTYKETMATLNKVDYTTTFYCMHGIVNCWYIRSCMKTVCMRIFETLLCLILLVVQLYEDCITCTSALNLCCC
jgi:hypothetical protein